MLRLMRRKSSGPEIKTDTVSSTTNEYLVKGHGLNVIYTCTRIYKSEVRNWIQIRILLSSSKNSYKNIDFYCIVTSLLLFIIEDINDVNVPSKIKKQENKKLIFCLRLEGHWRKEQDP